MIIKEKVLPINPEIKLIPLVDLIIVLDIDSSYSNIKRWVQKEGLKLNDKVITDINYMISELDIIDNKINIQVGKNYLYIVNIK